MPLIQSEYSCPNCKRNTGELNRIVANAGELLCSKNGEHKWNDTMSFYAEKPTMDFATAPAKGLPQQNYVTIKLSVPPGLEDTLRAKYGEKTEATMVSILMQMVEGNILIVGQTDLDRIAARLGAVPQNSAELNGMIYAKTEEVAEAKLIAENASRDLKAYEGLSPGRVVVNFGDQLEAAQSKARDAELPLAEWAGRALKNGLENQWF